MSLSQYLLFATVLYIIIALLFLAVALCVFIGHSFQNNRLDSTWCVPGVIYSILRLRADGALFIYYGPDRDPDHSFLVGAGKTFTGRGRKIYRMDGNQIFWYRYTVFVALQVYLSKPTVLIQYACMGPKVTVSHCPGSKTHLGFLIQCP